LHLAVWIIYSHPKKMTQYLWRVKTRLPKRYMAPCKILARGQMNTCLVEFEDGYRVTTSRNYLIKLETMQKRLERPSTKGVKRPEQL
jgi:hypothetical protein